LVYAALGLVNSGLGKLLKPDYTICVNEVYQQASSLMILERGDLYHLGIKSLRDRKRLKNLLTWVPDWSSPGYEGAVSFWSEKMSLLIHSRAQIKDSVMLIDGNLIDTVDFVLPMKELRRCHNDHHKIDVEA
jgi:hypothetical protein